MQNSNQTKHDLKSYIHKNAIKIIASIWQQPVSLWFEMDPYGEKSTLEKATGAQMNCRAEYQSWVAQRQISIVGRNIKNKISGLYLILSLHQISLHHL